MILTLDRSRIVTPHRRTDGGPDRAPGSALRRAWANYCSRWGSPFLINTGIDLSLDPPEEAAVPVLLDWQINGYDQTTYSLMVVVTPTETSIACTINFKLVKGKNSAVLTWSSPDQTTPHSATAFVYDPLRGEFCDLWWRWSVGGGLASEYELVATAAVYVPLPGEDPVENRP